MILGKFVTLKKAEKEHSDLLREWRNQDHVKKFMLTQDEISKTDHEKWFNHMLEAPDKLYFLIYYQDRPVGVINLIDLSKEDKSSEWAIYIGEQDLSGPFAPVEASYLLIKHTFDKLGVEKMKSVIHKDNKPALSLNKAMGFKYKQESADAGFGIYELFKEDFLRAPDKKFSKLFAVE